MKRLTLLALTFLLLTSACERSESTANPMSGRNPFTPVAVARPCGAVDLQTSSNSYDDAGAVVLGLTLINTSKSVCSLQGPAQVTLLDAGQPLDVQRVQAGEDAPLALGVSPGESLVLILAWRNYCGPALKDSPVIRLALANEESLSTRADVSVIPRCEAASDPSTLTVNPYAYPP